MTHQPKAFSDLSAELAHENGSGAGTRTLNLAVNRSPQPVQKPRFVFAECRRVPPNSIVSRPGCCTSALFSCRTQQHKATPAVRPNVLKSSRRRAGTPPRRAKTGNVSGKWKRLFIPRAACSRSLAPLHPHENHHARHGEACPEPSLYRVRSDREGDPRGDRKPDRQDICPNW